jgi:hypothetical protein
MQVNVDVTGGTKSEVTSQDLEKQYMIKTDKLTKCFGSLGAVD